MYDPEKIKEELDHRKGYEWLESDVEIMNLLLEKQAEGDEILNLFNIQFMDDSYKDEDMEEINRIYIIRDQMVWDGQPTSFDGDGYRTLVEIIIRTSNENYIQAQQLLKTTVLCIDQYLEMDKLRGWCKIREVVPRYDKPGKLREYRMELLCYEVKEKILYSGLSKDLRLDLCVQVGIENTDKEWHKLYPYVNRKTKPIRLHGKEKGKKYEKRMFGGG